MRSLPLLALMIMLGSCAAPSRPPPRAAPRPVAAPVRLPPPAPAPLASDWRDWPLTPGDWSYRQDDRGSIALFGPPGADAVLSIRCDQSAGAIYLSRAGAVPAPLTIRTSTVLRTLTAAPTGGTPAYIAASLGTRDPLLEAMGFSRGRFVVQQAGAATLVVPAWAEILRVTEDCRR